MVDQRFKANTPVGQNAGHPGAGHGIDDKYQGHDHQRRPKGAAGSLKQQHQSDDGDDHILGNRTPGSGSQIGVKDIQVRGAKRGYNGQNPVNDGDVVTR